MTAGDIDAILALERSCDSAPHWSRAEYLRCVDAAENSPGEAANGAGVRRLGLVAEVGSELAGFAVLRLVEAVGEAELESIVVAGEVRGRGIGSALLATVIWAAKGGGAECVELEVRASNAAATRLYERAGFAEVGRRRNYYSDPQEDAVLMRGSG